MEKVASTVMFPCKHASSGCPITLLHTDKTEHEETCEFRYFAVVFDIVITTLVAQHVTIFPKPPILDSGLHAHSDVSRVRHCGISAQFLILLHKN